MYNDSTLLKSNANQIKYPKTEVNNTCPTPVTADTPPNSFKTFELKPNPTINSSAVIPNFENNSTTSTERKMFKKYGPTIRPVKIYLITRGCLR